MSSAVLEHTMRLGIFRQVPGKVHFRSRQESGEAKEKKRKREREKRGRESSYEYKEAFQSRPICYHKISASSVSLLLVFMGDEESSLEIL